MSDDCNKTDVFRYVLNLLNRDSYQIQVNIERTLPPIQTVVFMFIIFVID